MQINLPSIYRMIQKLEDVSQGKQVWRGEGQAMDHPSIYSRELCSILRMRMLEYSCDHPLLIIRCFLNTMVQETELIADNVKSAEFRSKAGVKAQRASLTSTLGRVCISVDEMISSSTNEGSYMEEIIDTPSQGPSAGRNVRGEKDLSSFSCAPFQCQKSK